MSRISLSVANYKITRICLLLLFLCSLLNIPSFVFLPFYLPYSASLPRLLTIWSTQFSFLTGSFSFVIIGIIFAVLSVIPYLLCFIFSKKQEGWMIVALALYLFDTFFLFVASVPSLILGDGINVAEVLFHLLIIFLLSFGVYNGFKMKKERKEAIACHRDNDGDENEPNEGQELPLTAIRIMQISKKKSDAACELAVVCRVNGETVCTLKEGQSDRISVPCQDFELNVMPENGPGGETLKVSAGKTDLYFTIDSKTEATAPRLVIERLPERP